MRYFVCLLDPNGHGISEEARQQHELLARRRDLQFFWHVGRAAAVLTAWDDPHGDTMIAREGGWLAAGTVRLDNRKEIERWAGDESCSLSDLELVMRLVARHGTRHVGEVLGDFAFVVWDGLARNAVAACDAFAVNHLFWTERTEQLAFASRAEALALSERYETQYLTELLVRHSPPQGLTAFANVKALPAAHVAWLDKGKLRLGRYWHAATNCEPDHGLREQDAIATCRELLALSVRLRLAPGGETWAQLSGGLDSSSVVSLAGWLAERGAVSHGLAGTVTIVDRPQTPVDEREYSEAVVRRWRLRNELIVGAPTWHEEGLAPPRTDLPRIDLAFFPRDHRLCSTLRHAGARVLLTGWGGDELFMASMLYFADQMVQGHQWQAIRSMMRIAAIGRVSFWELAYRNALLPLLPLAAQRRLVHNPDDTPVQPWLSRAAMRRYDLDWQSPSLPEYAGARGKKYAHAIAAKIATLPTLTDHGLIADSFDVRYPMLYRPLVEFALRLPPSLRARPYAQRWILREAMRGILPEKVRRRVGKPETGDILAWSLQTGRSHLLPLVHDSLLAQLGIVDQGALSRALDMAQERTSLATCLHLPLLSTLAVEAWLQIRSGRWPRGGHPSSTQRSM